MCIRSTSANKHSSVKKLLNSCLLWGCYVFNKKIQCFIISLNSDKSLRILFEINLKKNEQIMGLLDGLEKIINEHGSATILKERISLANDKYSLLENKNKMLEENNSVLANKIDILQKENQTLRHNLKQTEQKVGQLEEKLSKVHNSNSDGYVCDHCGSSSLTRTGSRSDPTFGVLGVKQKLFSCDVCGKESAFTPEH